MKNNQTKPVSAGRGGKRAGAGRKPGSRNKLTQAVIKAVEESGITPKDFLLSVMRNDEMPMNARIEAGKSVAPYVHAKLVAIHETDGSKKTLGQWLAENDSEGD